VSWQTVWPSPSKKKSPSLPDGSVHFFEVLHLWLGHSSGEVIERETMNDQDVHEVGEQVLDGTNV